MLSMKKGPKAKNNTPKKAKSLGEVDMNAVNFHLMRWCLPTNPWNFPHCPGPKLQ